jgi:hypothetical protein
MLVLVSSRLQMTEMRYSGSLVIAKSFKRYKNLDITNNGLTWFSEKKKIHQNQDESQQVAV